MSNSQSKIRFQKVNLTTIITLFILILAGGVVRSTGSGMGCPDWPKCFGQYVPPTNVSELPRNYKKDYVVKRLAKNNRFTKILDYFGFTELATRIRSDKSILVPEEFNAFKTWTEYLNRIVGAVSGLFLLATAYYSFSYKVEIRFIPFISVLNVFLVVIQAWLGSIVVSTNLVPFIVTIHMVLALVILALSIASLFLAKVQGKPGLKTNMILIFTAGGTLVLTVLQIVFGTEVREKIDAVAVRLQGDYREDWVGNIGTVFYEHRSTALIIFVLNVLMFGLVRKYFGKHSVQQQLMSFTFLIIMLQIVTGIVLSYWSLPPTAQAVHILLSGILFGAQFFLFLNLFKSINYLEVRI